MKIYTCKDRLEDILTCTAMRSAARLFDTTKEEKNRYFSRQFLMNIFMWMEILPKQKK